MKKYFAYLLGALALMMSNFASCGCIAFILDEPKSKNFIKD